MREFDLTKFQKGTLPSGQYERQLKRLRSSGREVQQIEAAIRGAVRNLDGKHRSFVIYGEPQSGKTEMMICLTAKLIDLGYTTIIHLLNDSVDLLTQNLGRFKGSGLAPAARNFSEVLDPAIKIKGHRHVIFCKKNARDLKRLIEKLDGLDGVVVIDDEADYASPNSKINTGGVTKINELITTILGASGIYIGVTATPARLDLNNTFSNDSNIWVDFPPHSKYTGQDVFFPLQGDPPYRRTLLPDTGSDPRYPRNALFSFLANVAYLNCYVNSEEKCYSFLVHTSGKKADHKNDWGIIHKTLATLVDGSGHDFAKYTKRIWEIFVERYPDADPDSLTSYVLENITRHAIIILNSERDWKDNSTAATNPSSLFTIIIGGNIVSRGVTLNNLLSMFFTRDVKHKIQQDTYIQRARMFGSRGDYLRFFELTIPESLYLDWHRCFVFHRLALAAIKDGLGSLVWVGDKRISPVAGSSIDRSTVDVDRGEMSFGLFDYGDAIEEILTSSIPHEERATRLAEELGDQAFPSYLLRYIQKTSSGLRNAVFVHPPLDISNIQDADQETITRKKRLIGNSQIARAPASAVHHLFVAHAGRGRARLLYKFKGNIQFIRNDAHDS